MSDELDSIINHILKFEPKDYYNNKNYFTNFFKEFNNTDVLIGTFHELIDTHNVQILAKFYTFFIVLMNSDFTKNKIKRTIEQDNDFFEKVNKLLYSENIIIREMTIKFLGKLFYEDSIEYLKKALETYFLKNDPILIPILITALINLTDDCPWNIIEQIITNNNYIFRWTVLEIFRLNNLNGSNVSKIINKLCGDENDLVKRESEYILDKLEKHNEYEGMKYEDIKKTEHEFEYNEPKNMFYKIIAEFKHLLKLQNNYKYSLEELAAFINFFVKNNISISERYINEVLNK